MRTIKIFLASSEELDYDRMAFGNLVRRLDDLYEKRGIRIKLFEWEDYDAAFNDRRKQDEYNDHVRESDIFLALFHKKAGKFTIEEFDVASEEFKQHASPKVFTFCKDLHPDEAESPELAEFKKRLFEEMGHYWCRYDTRESLQLQFVMQLQLVESNQMGELKVEDGNVTLDGIRIAPMDKLRFAAANEDYVRMQTEMLELHEEIERMQLDLEKKQQKLEKKKAKLEKDPDDEEYQEEYQEGKEEVEELVDRLQPKLDKYNKLKEEYADYQKLLFDTAKRVAQLQGEYITDRMRRAMDAFSEGKVREANIILNEAEIDARRILEDYRQSKEITERKRQIVFSSIKELLLKTSTVMADASIPIEERIAQTEQIYAQADEMAKETEYDINKYARLLYDYGDFLCEYGMYKKSESVYIRQIILSERLYGENHLCTAMSYNGIGIVYYEQDDLDNALNYFLKALAIFEKTQGVNHTQIANLYHNVGSAYVNTKKYDKAFEYLNKALSIIEDACGKGHPAAVATNNSIGLLYSELNDPDNALKYLFKALLICKKTFGDEHLETAMTYNNIASVFDDKGDFDKAIKYYFKALKICEIKLGFEHPRFAVLCDKIGRVYYNIGDYDMALEYLSTALSSEKKVGIENKNIVFLYDAIGDVYKEKCDYSEALVYYFKAMEISERLFGINHPDTGMVYTSLSTIYGLLNDYSKATEYLHKAHHAFTGPSKPENDAMAQ